MKLVINPLFFIFWALFTFFGDTEFILGIFIAAAAHEAAHICAFCSFGAIPESIELLPFGISARLGNAVALSWKKEIICAAAGPAANLVIAAITVIIGQFGFLGGTELFTYCNTALLAVNLLPVLPLDGGRILWFTVLGRLNYVAACRVIFFVGLTVSVLTAVSGVFLIHIQGNPSLFIIAVYLLLYQVFERKS